MNVLNHLGIGLYSSTPAVVTEIIANAWDADAGSVDINIDPDAGTIVVDDDGHGMSAEDLQGRFLLVGYARRDQPEGHLSATLKRRVMGRKGIGKLAMFSLARQIEIWSRKAGCVPVAAKIDVERLKQAIRADGQQRYVLEDASEQVTWGDRTGTRIRLSQLLSGVDKTENYLRPRLSRRFSVFGDTFAVKLNGKPITSGDRGYHKDLQFLWTFDDQSKTNTIAQATNLAKDSCGELCVASVDPQVDPTRSELVLRGFIGSVDKPKKLKALEANINQISLFANGRLFQEDLLAELGSSQVFNSYLVGEVHADFLDADNIDRATASREAVKHGDPMVAVVRHALTEVLKEIGRQWDEWRRQIEPEYDDKNTSAAVTLWLERLTEARDRNLAERLVRSITRLEPTNDEGRNRDIRRDLLRSTVIGFEKLRIRQQLDRLENISDVASPEFHAIFTNIDDIEATYYRDITVSRLRVIEKFEAIVETKAVEKVAQTYLFNHLWLLDPSWDRISGSEVMEQTLTSQLKAIDPDTEVGARLDIAYRSNSGRHVIVELKRPGHGRINLFALLQQGDKYRGAMTKYLQDHPDLGGATGRLPAIDVFFVLESTPYAAGSDPIDALRAHNMQTFTYRAMIANARRAYQEYLQFKRTISDLEVLVQAM